MAKLSIKDLDLAVETYGGADSPLPITRRAREQFEEIMPSSAEFDISAIARRNGV